MQREVTFKDLELSRLGVVHFFNSLQPFVYNLWQFVQFHEELSKHLFLNGLLISSDALNLVPQLNLKWLAKSFLHLLLVNNINFNEV